jgi:plasmid stability protein
MSTMTLRGLDEQLKQRLALRAASHGRSMEDEAHNILRTALAQEEEEGRSLVEAIRSRIEPFGGVNLQIAPREGMRDAPRLET